MSQKCKLSKKGSPGEIWTGFRSSRSQIFFKIGVLKIFANPKRKHLSGDTFLKSFNPEGSVKKRLQHKCFPVKFAKYLRTPTLTEQLQWLPLTLNSYFQRIPERKPVRLLAVNTRFSWEKAFAVAKINTLVRKVIPEFIYLFLVS